MRMLDPCARRTYLDLVSLADEVPQLIIEGRRRAGLTQTKLAELVGVTQSTVSRWERARGAPSLHDADSVFSVLDLRVRLDVKRRSRPKDDGVDRAQIQARLRMSPEERLQANATFLRFATKARRALRDEIAKSASS
jgi:transcriptional regulator with XRE-family HTH domain